MVPKKLASAYADAVLDYLQTGAKQGIVYEGDLALFTDDVDANAPAKPLIWVDDGWQEFVSGISASVDPADPEFCATRLRAQIIQDLLVSGRVQQLAGRFAGLDGS